MKQLTGLLARKHEKIKQMMGFTQDIREVLKLEDTQKLVELFELRQQLMDEVDVLDEKLGSLFAKDMSKLLKAIEDNDEAKKIHNGLMEDLKKMQELDKENLQKAKTMKAHIAEDISGLKKAETAMKGYGFIGTTSGDGAFIDTKK